MTATPPPTRRDYRQIGVLALTSALVLLVAGWLHVFIPPSLAPRVNIRWAEGVSDNVRTEMEHQLKLVSGELLAGTTWAYDLGDPSLQGIEAIVTHPSVADTHHIDRSRRAVSDETRLGETRIRGGLSLYRDSPVVPWLVRLPTLFLGVSGLWFVMKGRPPS